MFGEDNYDDDSYYDGDGEDRQDVSHEELRVDDVYDKVAQTEVISCFNFYADCCMCQHNAG